MFLNCLHVASVLSQKNIYSSLLILVKLHVCFLLKNFVSFKKVSFTEKWKWNTYLQKGHLFWKITWSRTVYVEFRKLNDSLKDAQIWVREIMIVFAFSNIDNHSTTVQWMVTNDTDAREEKKYETITPSFDVVASQPMPRPYM